MGRKAGGGSSRALGTRPWHLEEREWEPQKGRGITWPHGHFRNITGAATWRTNFRGEPAAGPELGEGGFRWETEGLEGGQRQGG